MIKRRWLHADFNFAKTLWLFLFSGQTFLPDPDKEPGYAVMSLLKETSRLLKA
jgi:hypothetical protein